MIFDLIFGFDSVNVVVSLARAFVQTKRTATKKRETRKHTARADDRPNERTRGSRDRRVRAYERTNERTNGISFVEIDHSSVYDVRFKRRGARAIADAREEGSRVVLPV
jgi:hypothetical protein